MGSDPLMGFSSELLRALDETYGPSTFNRDSFHEYASQIRATDILNSQKATTENFRGFSGDAFDLIREMRTSPSTSSYDDSLSGSLSPVDLGFEYAEAAMLQRQRRARKPPDGYLCHLCFCKGHYIKDCPEVCRIIYFVELSYL